MTSSSTTFFNSVPFAGNGHKLSARKMAHAIRNIVFLTILVAVCCFTAFAQNGVQEFTASGTFVVPTGVTSLRLDAYGAGGGGGGSASSTTVGGGGGGGAYNSGAITVSAGEVLTIVVGKGGAGGKAGNPAGAGSAGGASKILNPSKVVIFSANGGQGGGGASGTTNGSPGAGGAKGTSGSVRHAGQSGGANSGGWGYVPVGYTNNISDAFGTHGNPGFGAGGDGGFNAGNGSDGSQGYILISW